MHHTPLIAAALLAASPSLAQTQTPLVPITPQAPAANVAFLPANTEVLLSMNDDLTTKGGRVDVGTKFDLTVVHDVKLGGLVVIPKGSRGVGEITWKTGKGAFGKSGKMEIELRYIDVGSTRVNITGKFRQEGEGNTVATVGTVVLVGVFAGFVTGKSARIPRGRELMAHTVDAIPVQLPPGVTAASLTAIEARPAVEQPVAAPATAPAQEAAPAAVPAAAPAPAANTPPQR